MDQIPRDVAEPLVQAAGAFYRSIQRAAVAIPGSETPETVSEEVLSDIAVDLLASSELLADLAESTGELLDTREGSSK